VNLDGLRADFSQILGSLSVVQPDPEVDGESHFGGYEREPASTSRKLTRWLANCVQHMSSDETHLAEDHLLLGLYHEEFLRAEFDRARLTMSVLRQGQ
jgi:hypothetical protein